MKRKCALCNCIILLGLLTALLVSVAGCGAREPKAQPEQFLGTWNHEFDQGFPDTELADTTTLELRSDGTGVRALRSQPHSDELWWVLYRDKLVLTPRDRSSKAVCDYQFNGPDELVLTCEGQDLKFRRAR
jgi:hypothetical protein